MLFPCAASDTIEGRVEGQLYDNRYLCPTEPFSVIENVSSKKLHQSRWLSPLVITAQPSLPSLLVASYTYLALTLASPPCSSWVLRVRISDVSERVREHMWMSQGLKGGFNPLSLIPSA